MNNLKGKFRTWKSGRDWMYARAMVILATGMCTGKATLADICFLETWISNGIDFLDNEEETVFLNLVKAVKGDSMMLRIIKKGNQRNLKVTTL